MKNLGCVGCGEVFLTSEISNFETLTEYDILAWFCPACDDAMRDIRDEMLMEDDGDALASAGRGTDEDYGYYGEDFF